MGMKCISRSYICEKTLDSITHDIEKIRSSSGGSPCYYISSCKYCSDWSAEICYRWIKVPTSMSVCKECDKNTQVSMWDRYFYKSIEEKKQFFRFLKERYTETKISKVARKLWMEDYIFSRNQDKKFSYYEELAKKKGG